jgi:hypothetical protein
MSALVIWLLLRLFVAAVCELPVTWASDLYALRRGHGRRGWIQLPLTTIMVRNTIEQDL